MFRWWVIGHVDGKFGVSSFATPQSTIAFLDNPEIKTNATSMDRVSFMWRIRYSQHYINQQIILFGRFDTKRQLWRWSSLFFSFSKTIKELYKVTPSLPWFQDIPFLPQKSLQTPPIYFEYPHPTWTPSIHSSHITKLSPFWPHTFLDFPLILHWPWILFLIWYNLFLGFCPKQWTHPKG